MSTTVTIIVVRHGRAQRVTGPRSEFLNLLRLMFCATGRPQ